MSIGLPWARSDIDASGYHVICPECGARCYPEGDGGYDNVEDSVTKGANLAYGLHYTAAHES